MRVALAQLNYTIAAFESNFLKIREAAAAARRQGAELMILSELSALGYPLIDLVEREDLVERNLRQVEEIAALSDDDFGILIGFVEKNLRNEGKALHNAAALLWKGKVSGTIRKVLLPTYDVFDEARYFEPGGRNAPMEFKGLRLGVTICEDAWSDPALWERKLYRRDPVQEMVDAGADLLINLSASPFSLGKAKQRRDMVFRHARKHHRFFIYVNQAGANDELVFDGHSMIVDPEGRMLLRTRDFAEDLLVYDLPRDLGRAEVSTVRDVASGEEEQSFRALVTGLRDYVRKSGFEKVVLGLSGGIDSALVAVLAAAALGSEHVLGVAMPTRYSSEGSMKDALALAGNLGIGFEEISIDGMFQSVLDGMAPVFSGLETDITEENIQARLRGMVLMALSNKLGSLVLATGNKSELGVGYCTLYGDMCGALAPISDLPKTGVYRLARWINREGEIIPENTITKPPSAELRPDQKDEDSLPPYELLDRILEGWVVERRSVEELVAEGLDREIVMQIVALIDRAEYKRRQAAPAVKISARAFGIGRRYPIVADYSSLHRWHRPEEKS